MPEQLSEMCWLLVIFHRGRVSLRALHILLGWWKGRGASLPRSFKIHTSYLNRLLELPVESWFAKVELLGTL